MKKTGIYITDNFVRFTQDNKEYQLDITSLNKQDLPHQIKKFLRENKITCENLVLGIPRNQITVRYLNLPSVNDKEIKRMVEYELNNLFPYKQDELIYDQVLIATNPEGYSQVMLVATKREVILEKLTLLKQAGLAPDAINISTVSLYNQFRQFSKAQKDVANYLLINLEDRYLDIIIVRRGNLSFSRGVKLGEDQRKSRLIKELKETINIQAAKGIEINRIVMGGRGVNLKELTQAIEQDLSVKVEIEERTCVVRGLTSGHKPNTLNIELLPEQAKQQKTKASRRKSVLYLITILLLNVTLFTNLIFLNMSRRRDYLHFLKSEIGKIEVGALLSERKMLRLEILKGYLNSGRLALKLLTEVYQIVPQGVYLTTWDISGQSPQGVFILTGQAEDTESVLKLAKLIKGSALISEAKVNYIKKRQSSSGEVVDFEINSSF